MSSKMNILLSNIGAWAYPPTPADNPSAGPQTPVLATQAGSKQNGPMMSTGPGKAIDGPPLLCPGNDPKPQPTSPTPPIRDPQGYKTIGGRPLGGNKEHDSMGGHHVDKDGVVEALEAFGVDIEKPVFARMVKVQGLVGLTPMQRFLRE